MTPLDEFWVFGCVLWPGNGPMKQSDLLALEHGHPEFICWRHLSALKMARRFFNFSKTSNNPGM